MERKSYLQKFRLPLTFLLLLYCGIGVIMFYDFAYARTPLDIITDSAKYEKLVEQSHVDLP